MGEQSSGQPGQLVVKAKRQNGDFNGMWLELSGVHDGSYVDLEIYGGEWGFTQQTWGYELDLVRFNGIGIEY